MRGRCACSPFAGVGAFCLRCLCSVPLSRSSLVRFASLSPSLLLFSLWGFPVACLAAAMLSSSGVLANPGSRAHPLVRCVVAACVLPRACPSSVIRRSVIRMMWLIAFRPAVASPIAPVPWLLAGVIFSVPVIYSDTLFAPSWRVGGRGVVWRRLLLSCVICLYFSGVVVAWRPVRLVAGDDEKK